MVCLVIGCIYTHQYFFHALFVDFGNLFSLFLGFIFFYYPKKLSNRETKLNKVSTVSSINRLELILSNMITKMFS